MQIHIPSYQMPDNSCCRKDGCPCNRCPDHTVRRHDTQPPFRVNVENCDGPLELEGLVLEANMWAKGRLRKSIISSDTYFQLADNIGFEQVMIGDIIIMERVRQPEHMLVIGFDEDNYFIEVQRGYNGTVPGNWKKGSHMRIFRVLNSPAVTESRYEDIEQSDGTTQRDTLTESYLVYEWKAEDTCLPGCYWLEFKLLKMKDRQFFLPGGKWIGTVTTDSTGSYFTGEFLTDGSVGVSVGIGDPYKLIQHIRDELPAPLYNDPNFIEPLIPTPDTANYDLWRIIVNFYPNPEDVNLRWQIWDRLVHLYPEGAWYSIPKNVHWTGPVHLWSDQNWYTGTVHDLGSVQLEVNGIAPQKNGSYNETGLVSILCDTCISTNSITPSFGVISGISDISSISTPSGISQIDKDFGCSLGAGVEWVRRFPTGGEGFLIKIEDSPTQEY